MIFTISRAFFTFLLVSSCLSCEEETEPYHGRQYITENRAIISLHGKYQGALLNDYYHLVFTPNRIAYGQTDCIYVRADGSLHSVVCEKISSTLFSTDFNNSLQLDINIKEDDELSINYRFQLIKIHGTNQVKRISGSNVTSPIPINPTNDSIKYPKQVISEEWLPDEYRVEDVQYDRSSGRISFKMIIRYHPDDDTDYELIGRIALKVYEPEEFTNN